MEALLIAILTGLSVTALGGVALLVGRERRVSNRARERALLEREGTVQRVGAAPRERRLTGTAEKLGHAISKGKASPTLKQELAAAGYHSAAASSAFLGVKLILLACGLLGSSALIMALQLGGSLAVMLVLLGTAVAFFLPNVFVSSRRRARETEIRRRLPDAVDLLEICVAAGMGMDAAWNSVAEEIRRVSPAMADEMELVNLEISLGVGRAVAMKHMAERTGVEDISSLVAMLVQSERFGASITDALRTFAGTMREIRSQRAEEAAEKMAVKMLFPMVVFIFPALFMVMVGPALLSLIENLM